MDRISRSSTCIYWTGYGRGHQLDKRLGAHLVRYADDFVVLCKRGTERPMTIIQNILTRLELTLNKSKTRMVNASQECFDFLGFELRIARSWRTGNLYPNVQPSRKSLKTIKSRLTVMTRRGLTRLPLEKVVENVNLTLRGWTAYFHYRNCSKALSQVREHAEQRVRVHLRRRHKIKDRGTGYLCFTGSSLYIWALQSANNSRLDECASLTVKNIGKPCAGKPHARFDEGGLVKVAMARPFRHRQTKGTETDKSSLRWR